MEPWYKVATPRTEVREGRSFNPDEFAIALEQVVAGTAPEDYREPAQFFARTCFTRALREHAGMVLRRLSRRTDNTSPVLTLTRAMESVPSGELAARQPPGRTKRYSHDAFAYHDCVPDRSWSDEYRASWQYRQPSSLLASAVRSGSVESG